MPIGTIDVIDNFKPDELRDYYHKWYRPDLQAIIIVGDINVDQVETAVKRIFADIPAPVNAAPRPLFEVPDNDMPLISVFRFRDHKIAVGSLGGNERRICFLYHLVEAFVHHRGCYALDIIFHQSGNRSVHILRHLVVFIGVVGSRTGER